MQTIDVLRMNQMRRSHSTAERIGFARRDDQMHVIGHQAIARHRQTEPLSLFAQRLEVEAAIIIGEEVIVAIVAALRDMMRDKRG